MHPLLAQELAQERIAELRSAAATTRRARRPVRRRAAPAQALSQLVATLKGLL